VARRAKGVVRWISALAVVAALAPATAGAERAAGIAGNLTLVLFDTAAPADVSVRLITGLQTSGEKAIALDWRPATGELFLVTAAVGTTSGPGDILRSYRLDPATAAATFVAELPAGTPGGAGDWPTGADFNPVVDRLRVVNSNLENFRINPNNGALAGDDPDLTFTAPATGPVTAVAYDRNVAPGPPGTPPPPGTLTTLYGIDVGSERLVVQGGINGAGAGGPNGGAVTSIGPLGIFVDSTSDAGFDIAPGGTAYAALRSSQVPNLYTIDLGTGAATLVGPLALELRALTILPPIVPPPPPPPPDVTDPTLRITGAPRRLSFKRFVRGVVARIAPSEAVSLEVALLGRARRAGIARVGDVVLAERRLGTSAATRRVRLKPRRRLVGRARRFSVRLRVIATDAAGNRSTAVRTIRVRRPARR
jgi:Domain of unknown function (DUF4394)